MTLYSIAFLQVRFVKGDSFWLSNDYQRDSCHVTLLLHNPSDYNTHLYFYNYYQRVLQYGGRPHWGKSIYYILPDEAKSLYPKFAEFQEVYTELDPDRIFANDLLERILGI